MRLRICAGSSESLMLGFAVSIIILDVCPYAYIIHV